MKFFYNLGPPVTSVWLKTNFWTTDLSDLSIVGNIGPDKDTFLA